MIRLLLLLLFLSVLPGCSVLQPVKDYTVHHVLEPLVPQRALVSSLPVIAIKRPSLPGYLDRQQLVTRSGGELKISGLDLWGEPLDAGISRVMASNLSRLTRSMNVQPVENFTALEYASLLELRISSFEPDTSGSLMVLQGTWRLQPVSGGDAATRYFHMEAPIPAGPPGMTARVTAMNETLAALSRQIMKQGL